MAKSRFQRRINNISVSWDEEYMTAVENYWTVSEVPLVPNCFYGFFDETGDEKLVLGQEFFAFSGFGFTNDFRAEDFTSEWSQLKKNLLCAPENEEYHSKRYVRKFWRKGHKLLPITNFLKSFPISFMSCCVLNTTIVDHARTDKNIKVVEGLFQGLSDQTSRLFQNQVQRDEWYFEHSFRLNPISMACRPPEYFRSQQHGGLHLVKKRSMISMVEVADFISYLVFHHIQSIYSGQPSPYQAAYTELFGDSSRGAFDYISGLLGPIHVPVRA